MCDWMRGISSYVVIVSHLWQNYTKHFHFRECGGRMVHLLEISAINHLLPIWVLYLLRLICTALANCPWVAEYSVKVKVAICFDYAN